MGNSKTFRMIHSIDVDRPATDAYRLINAVEAWPKIFPPCEGARVVETDGERLTIEITAHVGGEVRTWRSRRRLNPQELRVDFEQQDPFPPLVGMTGYWHAEANGEQASRIHLVHDFATSEELAARATPPKTLEEAEAWIRQVCDANSHAELAAFKKACEAGVV